MINCIRLFDITDLEVIDRMTINEYQIRMKAASLKEIDNIEKIYMSAWANVQAKATNKKGKSIYKNFKQFFNKAQMEEEIYHPTDEKDTLSSRLSRAYQKQKSKERR